MHHKTSKTYLYNYQTEHSAETVTPFCDFYTHLTQISFVLQPKPDVTVCVCEKENILISQQP